MSDTIVVARGPVSLTGAGRVVVISGGDVRIDSGSTALVIAAGKIEFTQNPQRDWAGIFVAKGTFTAPWLTRAVIHARGGAFVHGTSLDLLIHDSRIEGGTYARSTMSGGRKVFSDSLAQKEFSKPLPEPPPGPLIFAGERCAGGVPLADIAQRMAAIAREKFTCREFDIAIATCPREGVHANRQEEVWITHGCRNLIAVIAARQHMGRSLVEFVPPPPSPTMIATAIPPADPDAIAKLTRGSQPQDCPRIASKPDQLDLLNRSGPFGFSLSAVANQQAASFFTLEKDSVIHSIEWSGVANHVLAGATFLLRVFQDRNGEPGDLRYERQITSSAAPLKSGYASSRGRPYLFSGRMDGLTLGRGDYWLSIVDTTVNDMKFAWSWEPGTAHTTCGRGGAFRQGDKGEWTSRSSPVPSRKARGFSFRIAAQ